MASKMNPGFMAMMAKKKDSAKDGGMHKMPDGKMMKNSAMKKMASGGMTGALAKHASMPASKAHNGMKHGGSVKSADGIASKGKTKGKVI